MTKPELVVAPLTPFTADLKIDAAALKREIDYVIEDCGATMVVAAGVEAQEYTYLDMTERKELIRRTVEFVAGRCPVMVGISHPSFRTALELAHFADDLGAHAVQMLAPLRPFGGAPTERDLVAYFEAVAQESPLPLALYLNAGPGADVSIPATIAIARVDNVRYIKESSRDLARVSRLIVEIDHAGHARYFTTVQMLLATLELGGSGATMPPPVAEIARQVIDATSCRRPSARGADPVAVRPVSVQMDASWPDGDDEDGDAPDRAAAGGNVPALCIARCRRNRGTLRLSQHHSTRKKIDSTCSRLSGWTVTKHRY